MASAREQVLARVREAGRKESYNRRAAEYGAILRGYRTQSHDREARLELLADRLLDYGSAVHRCRESELAATVRQALAGREQHWMLAPPGVPRHWLPEGIVFRSSEGLSYDEIDAAGGVITGCTLAIALTGTLILRHSAAEGRRASTLIPDYHLCVVFEDQVVGTVAEAMARLGEGVAVPMTTISGSSATSDIEMTRVKGVHGPRTLDVILVKEGV